MMIIQHRKFSNRGFLIGPICPIYGVGAVLGTLIIGHDENIFQIFCASAVFAGVIEYVTSFLMEKVFHARWWDYSKKPFNLNGRICLQTLFLFGVMGIVAIKLVSPFLFLFFSLLNDSTLLSLALVLSVMFVCDIFVSLYLIICFRVTANVTTTSDATAEITANIRQIFEERGRLGRRLVGAFPTMKVESPEARRARKNTKIKQKQTRKAARKKPKISK